MKIKVKPKIPTIDLLVKSDRQGIWVRNPETKLKFRVVIEYFGHMVVGVSIYKLNSKRAIQKPLLCKEEIAQWLKTLELV